MRAITTESDAGLGRLGLYLECERGNAPQKKPPLPESTRVEVAGKGRTDFRLRYFTCNDLMYAVRLATRCCMPAPLSRLIDWNTLPHTGMSFEPCADPISTSP